MTATPQDREVTIDGLRIHYLEWGEPTGQPMVFLHGVMQQAHSWDWVAREFVDRYRVIVPDLRGHGDSDWDPNKQYDQERYQRDLGGLVDALGIGRFVIVGLSLGGMISIRYTASHPDRILGLGIVDIAPTVRERGAQNIRDFAQQPDEFDFEALVERSLKFNPTRTAESLRGSLRNNLRELPSGKWTWKYDSFFRQQRQGERQRPDLWPYLAAIHEAGIKTLFVRGERSDVVSEEDAQELVSALPGVRYVTIPNATHTVPGDQPAAFAAALRSWLTEESVA